MLDRPDAAAPRYRDHLSELAEDVGAASERSGGLAAPLAALTGILVDKHGYRGDRDTYDDLRNADLAHVIDRRRGLPVALAILWLHAGRAQGWSLDGLNVPGHFLLRLDAGGERAVIDPFNGGRSLDAGEIRALVKAVAGENAELPPLDDLVLSNRGILLRLQNNIKTRRLQRSEPAEALAVLERMLLLAPEEAALWREAGLLHATIENMRAALSCLETAAGLAESPATRQRIAAELAGLRSKLN